MERVLESHTLCESVELSKGPNPSGNVPELRENETRLDSLRVGSQVPKFFGAAARGPARGVLRVLPECIRSFGKRRRFDSERAQRPVTGRSNNSKHANAYFVSRRTASDHWSVGPTITRRDAVSRDSSTSRLEYLETGNETQKRRGARQVRSDGAHDGGPRQTQRRRPRHHGRALQALVPLDDSSSCGQKPISYASRSKSSKRSNKPPLPPRGPGAPRST